MADLGWAGMAGAGGVADAMSTLFNQRMEAAKLAQQADEFQKSQAQQDALTKLKIQELTDATRERAEARQDAMVDRAAAGRYPGDPVTPEEKAREMALGYTASMYTPHAPLPGTLASTQYAPTGAPSAPSMPPPTPLSPLGPLGAPSAPGPVPQPDAAPDTAPEGGTPSLSTFGLRPIQSAAGPDVPQPDTWRGTFTQLQKIQEDKAKQGEADWKNYVSNALLELKQAQGGKPGSIHQDENGNLIRVADDNTVTPIVTPNGKPVKGFHQTPTWIADTVDENGNIVHVVKPRVVGSTAVDKPTTASAKSVADVKNTIAAVDQTQSALDSVKDLVGPGAGRGETVEQWLGNADPKIQAFGVKLFLTKQAIDRQITGSARAGASTKLLERWDNFFSNKVSYDGMKSGLQAAKEILSIPLQGASGTGGGPTKKTAEELIKQYGGGQ